MHLLLLGPAVHISLLVCIQVGMGFEWNKWLGGNMTVPLFREEAGNRSVKHMNLINILVAYDIQEADEPTRVRRCWKIFRELHHLWCDLRDRRRHHMSHSPVTKNPTKSVELVLSTALCCDLLYNLFEGQGMPIADLIFLIAKYAIILCHKKWDLLWTGATCGVLDDLHYSFELTDNLPPRQLKLPERTHSSMWKAKKEQSLSKRPLFSHRSPLTKNLYW